MIGRLHHVVLDCREPTRRLRSRVHLDVMVEDVEDTGRAVLALGATALPGTAVYADPAGHPFCLLPRPGWAPPVG